MTISAKVICDSFSQSCKRRITTMELEYPRFIHAEFMTHRVFSRNASSSRAIPVKKMIETIKTNPAMPIHWGMNQPGMQAEKELGVASQKIVQGFWLKARDQVVSAAESMLAMDAHKQIVNRILEPFMHIKVIVTATNYENFFALRDHPDAQPEIRELARVMKEAMAASQPNQLGIDEWHLPYLEPIDHGDIYDFLKQGRITRDEPSDEDQWLMACAVSAARCARVSYLTHNGERPSLQKDLELYYRLIDANPPHMSPCEHQARPDSIHNHGNWTNEHLHGNFTGWCQFRKTINGESIPG